MSIWRKGRTLVVMRSVAMIANGAADLVQRRIATAAAIDSAMRDGANYLAGPLAWAEAIGLPRILAVIDNLARLYGEDRYRASPLLRRHVLAGRGSRRGRGPGRTPGGHVSHVALLFRLHVSANQLAARL